MPGKRRSLVDITRESLSRERARRVLRQNKDVPFIKRMLKPKDYPPARKNEDKTVSTHLLSTAEVDGTTYVYPTLRLNKGEWVEDDDVMTALDAGNVVAFDDFDEADEFAKGSWKLIRRP